MTKLVVTIMNLPNSDKSYVPAPKLSKYLLSLSHPEGGSKAKFFRAFGFDDSNTDLLESGLNQIARSQQVKETETTGYGVKYTIIGELPTPVGRTVTVETVWIIENGQTDPRFVTAYPG